jgi:hypothetical protein
MRSRRLKKPKKPTVRRRGIGTSLKTRIPKIQKMSTAVFLSIFGK